MPNYMVKHQDITHHFFSAKNEGLVVRSKRLNIWQNHKIIYQDCSGIFSVLCDSSGTLHAICTNKDNEIIYLHKKNGSWQSTAITKLKEEMKVLEMTLWETGLGLNLIYSASFSGEKLLIHCLLGNNAMPNTLDRLLTPDYFIFKNRIYYQNQDGLLGYRDISDGKPDPFNMLTQGGNTPYLLNYNAKDMITYLKEGQIYFQNRPIIKDNLAQSPILVGSGEKLFLMWKNGDFIRYIESTDNGSCWSSVMQFVSTGRVCEKYLVVHNKKIYAYFGNHTPTELKIYGKSNVFEKDISTPVTPQNYTDTAQLTKLKIMLEMQKNELTRLKREITRLRDYISTLNPTDIENNAT